MKETNNKFIQAFFESSNKSQNDKKKTKTEIADIARK